MEESKMKKHVTAVGAIHIGLGSIRVILSVFAYVFLSKLLNNIPTNEMPDFVASLLSGIFNVMPIVFGCVALMGVIGGIGLLSCKSWARILVLIVSILGCIRIPIGTLVGVYSLWTLMQDETIKLFKQQGQSL
jgi:hypothetical protein